MMMLVMMMPNVNVWGDTKKEYYIARKHVFVFKVSLFYFLFFFIFSKTSTRENDF